MKTKKKRTYTTSPSFIVVFFLLFNSVHTTKKIEICNVVYPESSNARPLRGAQTNTRYKLIEEDPTYLLFNQFSGGGGASRRNSD